MRNFATAPNEAAPDQVNCPRCERPCARTELVRGVCPACKRNLESAHAKILKLDYHEAPVGIDRKLHEVVHFDENSRRVATTDDPETGEEFISGFCQNWAVNQETAMLMIADVANHLGAAGTSSMDGMVKARELIQRLAAALARLIKYGGDTRMFARALAMRMEFFDVAGGRTFVEVARACSTSKHTVSKQTFLKCFHVVEEAINLPQYDPLPPLAGQRDEESNLKMSEAQKRIWRNAPIAKSKKRQLKYHYETKSQSRTHAS